MMTKTRKPKKRRPVPLTFEVQPSWNLGRVARIKIESERPMAEFLKDMKVKKGV